MTMIRILPVISAEKPAGPPVGGVVHTAPRHCEKADRNACRKHYESVEGTQGLSCCPYGYATYVTTIFGERVIFSGLNVSGCADQGKLSRRQSQSVPPKISLLAMEEILG